MIYQISVDSRTADPKTVLVVKYTDLSGRPIQYKPIRKIYPNFDKLTETARFIVSRLNKTYIGGMLCTPSSVRVQGIIGSQWEIDLKIHGLQKAELMYKIGLSKKTDRATIKGWQWPVFEPNFDETEYFNIESNKMETVADGGRIIINGEIYDFQKYLQEV